MWSDFGDWLYSAAHIPWWTTSRVTATTAVVAVIGGLTTATVAIKSLRHTRADSRARTRPMLSAELKISGDLHSNLVIKNSGASIARNVTIVFDPPLPNDEYSSDGQGNVARLINQRYQAPIPVWVPGREMENFYWIRDQDSPDDAPLSVDGVPNEVVATISYSDDQGRTYCDRFPLDIRELWGAAMPVKTTRHTSTQKLGSVVKGA